MSAPSTLALARMSWHGTITPMLTTSKLLHWSTTVTMFLPMSCTSPLTVAMTILPLALAPRRRPRPAPSSRPRCRAAGGPPPASSRARSSPPAAGTSCPGRTGRRRCSCRPSAGLRSRAAAGRRRRWIACQASSVSSTMKSVMPCTSAWLRRSSTGAGAPGEPRAVVLGRALGAFGDLDQALAGVRRAGSAPRPRRARAARARGRRRRRPCRR